MDVTLDTINFNKKFKSSHHVSITQVLSVGIIYYVLVNIWKTELYKSQTQQILVLDKFKISKKYKLPNTALWKCILVAEGGFLLGSKYSVSDSGAILAFYKDDTIIISQLINKGYATEIVEIKNNSPASYIVNGVWYQNFNASGHDDFYSVPWSVIVRIESALFTLQEVPAQDHKKMSIRLHETRLDPHHYYLLEDFGISKYTNDNILLWNQGVGHIKLEYLKPIDKIAFFYRMQGCDSIFDGVWYSGSDNNSGRGFPKPFFGYVSKDGSIIRFQKILNDYPEIKKIHTIISGKNYNCLLIAETLKEGKGNGLCLLYFHSSWGITEIALKYINSDSTSLHLKVEDEPRFF